MNGYKVGITKYYSKNINRRSSRVILHEQQKYYLFFTLLSVYSVNNKNRIKRVLYRSKDKYENAHLVLTGFELNYYVLLLRPSTYHNPRPTEAIQTTRKTRVLLTSSRVQVPQSSRHLDSRRSN